MDGAGADLYFPDMNNPSPRPDVRATAVPAFFLYGELLRAPDERLVHVETLAARSRQHDWFIGAHRHRDLHQLLLVRRGRVEASLDGAAGDRRAPFAVIVPPGVVHAFRFQPDSAGLVVSLSTGLVRDQRAMTPEIADFVDRPGLYALGTAAFDATDAWPLGQMLLREFGRAAPGRHAALRGLLGALLANLVRLAGDTSALPAPARATRGSSSPGFARPSSTTSGSTFRSPATLACLARRKPGCAGAARRSAASRPRISCISASASRPSDCCGTHPCRSPRSPTTSGSTIRRISAGSSPG